MKKINSPIPASLAKECEKAAKILNAFVDPKSAKSIDKVIPKNILERCKGIAILTIIKAGFIWSGRVGSGLVFARLPDGSKTWLFMLFLPPPSYFISFTRWSAPSAIGTAGIGVGGQIGAELTDFVMILNTSSAVKAFSHGGNVTLGGNIGVAAGPFGRSAEVSGAVLNVAPVFSYSKSKGLFAGVSLEGSVILERKDANEKFYGRRVSANSLLTGQIEPPPQASSLYRAMELKSSSSAGLYGSPAPGSAPPSNPYDDSQTQNYGTTNYSASPYGTNASRLNNPIVPEANGGGYQSRYSAPQNNPPNYLDTTGGVTRNVPEKYGVSTQQSRNTMPQADAYYGQASRNTGSLAGNRAPPPPPPMPQAPKERTATALYAFNGDAPGDLRFNKGDVITITKSTATQDDWWEGKCNGLSGQ
ncbi:SH3 domain-containing protein, partial [Smittium mucronatum]